MTDLNQDCNGITEEDGAIVKRVTLTTIYHKVKAIEKNQNKICEKLEELTPKVGEVNGHKKLLEDHILFCKTHRMGIEMNEENIKAYEQGRLDVTVEADKKAEERLKRSAYFWAKILIPATALLLGAVYYFADRLIF